ncbi:efflux RND transporter periplasmic adaptor subunit [Cohnella faecalis]|uniref:Efflux RND transporter periplasmic adaptor subunit n=1 Tax=Cohnella faecalis TaxID=2315694 RepID=A0A398CRN0_9BACL|nr:efflux RND transporter periplasmic adaptor subunit [Cohnella faecalis]RIE04820.1 efflux RND transporter periplasmic adaptor subunit [Cohnella faecalis]
MTLCNIIANEITVESGARGMKEGRGASVRWKKWTLIGLSVIVVGGGATGGWIYWKKDDKPLAAGYSTTVVRKGTLEVKVSGTGTIEPANRQSIKASSGNSTIKSVLHKEGDTVKKGDVLATFEQTDVSSQVKSKQLELKSKKLDLTDLQTKYKTAEDDDSRASIALSIQKQQLNIEMAEADIESLQEDNSIDPIVAPIDGQLTGFDLTAGDALGQNTDLGEVVDYTNLQMVVGVDELDISTIKKGQKAQISVEAISEKTYEGEVVAIADEGTASNGVSSFDVTISVSEPVNLKAGMSAEANILTESKENALYLPIEAVQSLQGQYYVMVPASGSSQGTGTGPSGGQGAGQGAANGANGQAGQTGQTGQAGQSGQGTQAAQSGQGAKTDNQTGTAPQNGQTGQAAPSGGAGQSGQAGGAGGQGGPGGGFGNMTDEERQAMREQFQNMSDEDRQSMRSQFSGGRGAGAGVAATTTGVTATSRVNVEIGIKNEDSIEIVSGLTEGQQVVLPTVTSSSSSQQNQGFPGGGFGVGGITGGAIGGGGMPGGGFQGGQGGQRQTTTTTRQSSGGTGGGSR